MRPEAPRDPLAGPDAGPESPFPIRLSGPVIKGFGRGSKELGIPTANIPPDGLSEYPDLESGVYYGVAALDPAKFKSGEPEPGHKTDTTIFPCVLSIGYNPFYKNTVRSVEIHILPNLSLKSSPSPSPALAPSTPTPTPTPNTDKEQNNEKDQNKQETHSHPHFHHFPDFYGTPLNLLILGYIRPEYDYVSLEALVEDIRFDCDVARRSLAREAYSVFMKGDGDEDGADDDDDDDEKAREQRVWLRRF